MRYAMFSGYLAAQSIINSYDYYKYYKEQILPKLKVGVSNRFIFQLLGRKSYKWFINYFAKSNDPLTLFGNFYNPSFF